MFLPAILVLQVNWKLDLVLTIPLAIASQIMTTLSAYATEGGNMDCYNQPEAVGGSMALRYILFFFFIVYQVYVNHKHELRDLIQRDKVDK